MSRYDVFWPNAPQGYKSAFERLPLVLQAELDAKGWSDGVDWASIEDAAATLSIAEMEAAIERFAGPAPTAVRIRGYYESRLRSRLDAMRAVR